MKKNHIRPTLQLMIRMTLDCVRPTQFSVIQIIHCNVGLKCFFQFCQNVCYYRYTCIFHSYFTR